MKPYFFSFLFFLYLLCFPRLSWGQEESFSPAQTFTQTFSSSVDHLDSNHFPLDEDFLRRETEDLAGRESESFQTKFFNMLFLLGLLIGFMILASWALKRMMRTKITQLNTASEIKIIETRYLSPRATLYLIETQGQQILIAESPSTVSYLTKLSENEHPLDLKQENDV